MQSPLSRDERAAMARYLTGIKKQLQDVSELFTARYGKESRISEKALEAVAAATLLEEELVFEREEEAVETNSQRTATTV